MNRDKLPDRETQRWEKHHQAPGQRGRNSKILPGSQRQRDSKGRRSQGLKGKYGDREPPRARWRMRYKGIK